METTIAKDRTSTVPYWNIIKHLTDRDKLELIVLLSQSLKEGNEKAPVSAKDFYGIWGDDGYTIEEFIDELKN